MNSPEACRTRLLKYMLPVIIISIAFNIPKFMEAEICWKLTANATEVEKLLLDYSTQISEDKNYKLTASTNNDLSARHNMADESGTHFPVCKGGINDVDILLTYDEIWKPRVS